MASLFVTEATARGSVEEIASSGDFDGCEREHVSGASGGAVRRRFGIFFGAGDGEVVVPGDAAGTVIEAGSEAL